MRRALTAAAASAIALVLMPAPALPCGSSGGGSSGGGGGSSGGGGGDSGSSSSSSSSGSSSACAETSVVVGRQQCDSFGRWDVSRWPRLRFGFGSSLHAFSLASATFEGTANHDAEMQYRLVDDDLDRGSGAIGGTFDLRMTGRLREHLYVGAEVGFGGASVANPRVVNLSGADALKIDPAGGALLLSYGAVVGGMLPLGRVTITGELLAGGRSLGLSTTTSHDDCVGHSVAWNHRAVLQSRLGIQTWLGPWWSATAWVGRDQLDEGGSSFGLVLQGHMRAFDGGR